MCTCMYKKTECLCVGMKYDPLSDYPAFLVLLNVHTSEMCISKMLGTI